MADTDLENCFNGASTNDRFKAADLKFLVEIMKPSRSDLKQMDIDIGALKVEIFTSDLRQLPNQSFGLLF